MDGVSALRQHVGDWISVRAHTERTPWRLTITFELGELPQPWRSPRRSAHTSAAILGLVCIAPFTAFVGLSVLRGLGVTEPYAWLTGSSTATAVATMSLFVGIPVAVAVNLWRVARAGVSRSEGLFDGMLALEFAPLHLLVLAAAALMGALFVGHLAADSLACLNGVRSAC